jgi:prepilin-type N-terminal cleavage/methylation domain-containing protein
MRALGHERGFTLIELLIAALVVAVGVLSLIATFDSSRQMVSLAERKEVAAHQGQRELERVLAMEYDEVALIAHPGTSTNPSDPRSFVNGNSYRWDQGPTGPRTAPLVIDSVGGRLTPSSGWTDGQSRLSGRVYRFVTRAPTVGPDVRRITIAVTVDGEGGPDKPVLTSSMVWDETP